jgi:uncharacterized membrane protein YidH (DUF202 family)
MDQKQMIALVVAIVGLAAVIYGAMQWKKVAALSPSDPDTKKKKDMEYAVLAVGAVLLIGGGFYYYKESKGSASPF